MDEFILGRGDKHIRLIKSTRLIGVRALAREDRSGPDIDMNSDRLAETPQYLAGFKIFEVNGGLERTEHVLDELRERNPKHTGTHIYQVGDNAAAWAPTGKIAVRLRSGTIEAIQEEFQLSLVSDQDKTYILAVTAASPNPLKVALALQDRAHILMAEADLSTPGELQSYIAPTDAYFKQQWHLSNLGDSWELTAGADARVVPAWEELGHFGSPDCIIAVIDDGFDLDHPDIGKADRLTAPYDFEKSTNDPSPQNYLPWPGDIHGTATAGLALGAATGECIVGVAPGCGFMPLRWSRNLNDDSIRDWFGHARDKGAWVVNCSWTGSNGYVLSTLQNEAIADCAAHGRQGKGCVIVFSAGNRNAPAEGFALHPDVIAVAACTSNDEHSKVSSFGQTVALCAPSWGMGGRKIVTANVKGMVSDQGTARPRGWSDIDQDFTADFGGTSASAPIVSGVCGLVLSAAPQLNAKQVKDVLIKTARKIGQGYHNGHSDYFGYGCVNALEAVKLAKTLSI